MGSAPTNANKAVFPSRMKLLGSAPSNNLGVLGGNIFCFKKGGVYSCFFGGACDVLFSCGPFGFAELEDLSQKKIFLGHAWTFC